MKLLRTIALDPSDTFVFDLPAEPGEWAVSGAFRFWSGDPSKLEGKTRAAFLAGFLGLRSWGWSTLVQIVEATDADRSSVVDLLARQLVDRLGAPDVGTARRAAEEEISFVESLCSHPVDTLIAVQRTADNGEVREAFRALHPRGGSKPLRAFSFQEVEERPDERVDLIGMASERERR